jgi:hypothetical protein
VAGENVLFNLNAISASDLAQYVPVKQIASDNVFGLAATTTDDIIGVSQASSATYGSPVPVAFYGISKVLCGASIGAGARVGIASTNGAVGPIIPTGAAASGAIRTYVLGRSLKAAAPGDYLEVVLDPTELI